MAEEIIIVFTTWPDATAARAAAETLVREKLAACASVLPGVESIYRWKGNVERAAEVLAIIKTTAPHYAALEQRLRTLHPYEVPEIVSLRVSDGLPAYLQWVAESCGEE
jgi:periplasmic divalent cation tolerance protein